MRKIYGSVIIIGNRIFCVIHLFQQKANNMAFTHIFTLILLFFVSLFNAQSDEKFYQPSKTMQPLEFKKTEELSIPVGSDRITAVIAKPEKKFTKTVLFFHGAGGNISTYQYITKPLVEAGYQVIMVDFRGYGKSTGVPTHISIGEDGQVFLEEMLKRDDVKNTKVYLYGASLGAQIAANLAKNNESKLSGVILDCPMESFTEIAVHFAPQYEEMIRNYVTSPYSAIEDLKELKKLPKLVITSKEDKTIPYQQQLKVYESAAEPKKQFESSGDHIQGMVNNRTELLKIMDQL